MSQETQKIEWAATFKAIAGEKFDEFKTAFSALKAKYNAAPLPAPTPPATPAPVALAPQPYSANITGGAPIFTDISDDGIPGIDMGDSVFTDATLGVPYPDGAYTLDDGTQITVAGGIITVYTPGTAPVDPGVPGMNMSQFKAAFASEFKFAKEFEIKFAALQTENTELKKSIEDHNTQLKSLVEFADMVMTTPVSPSGKPATQMKALTDDEVANLSASDQVKYNRGKL